MCRRIKDNDKEAYGVIGLGAIALLVGIIYLPVHYFTKDTKAVVPPPAVEKSIIVDGAKYIRQQ